MSRNRIIRVLVVITILGAVVRVAFAQNASPNVTTTYIVNSSADLGDISPADNLCLTETGLCTLRAAIEQSNADPADNIINFESTVTIIFPASAYEPITGGNITIQDTNNNVIIMGTNASLPDTAPAFEISSNGNKIQGVTIIGFHGGGIIINGGDNNVIGTNGDGINDSVEGNQIGSCGEYSDIFAIHVVGAYNRISGNEIGATIGSNYGGIHLVSGSFNLIGTDGDGTSDTLERNVISNNTHHGILIESNSNTVAGNYVGVNQDGDEALGNGEEGIMISNGADSNIIGTNGDGNGDSIEGNVISGNVDSQLRLGKGIYIDSGSNDTVIAGNYIGTNAFGTAAIPNEDNGIDIHINTDSTRVGTNGDGISDGAEGNLISGNGSTGLNFNGSNGIIAGNYIGTSVTGVSAIPNDGSGVNIEGSNIRLGTDGNEVSDLAERNLISGNELWGIFVSSTDYITDYHTIAGNYIGTNISGEIALENGAAGVFLSNAISVTIGGSLPNTPNVISGNHSSGIVFTDLSFLNSVQGNYIGVSATGSAPLGNGGIGIALTNSYYNSIGGEAPNVISCNGNAGIYLSGDEYPQTANQILGNYIGVLVDKNTPCGNQGAGIFLNSSTAYRNTIGGIRAGEGNIIANNTSDGIAISNAGPTENKIRGNYIYNNAEEGIDLWGNTGNDGVTPNDGGDIDTGPNDLQNYPVLQEASFVGDTITVNGTLSSHANTTYFIDFYLNKSCDPSGNGEGEIFRKSIKNTSDGSGFVSFSTEITSIPEGFNYLTATATDPDGNTSEFSSCLQFQFMVNLPIVFK